MEENKEEPVSENNILKENISENRKKKVLTGKVVSTKMDKTIVVQVDRIIKHPIYRKYIKRSRRFKAHDNNNQAKLGSTVKIIECRPLSKEKTFRVLSTIEKATRKKEI